MHSYKADALHMVSDNRKHKKQADRGNALICPVGIKFSFNNAKYQYMNQMQFIEIN